MKRAFLILTISLLFVSGWGTVLADTLCPHKQASRARQKPVPAETQKQRPSCHEEMAMDDMEPAAEPPAPSAVDEGKLSFIEQPGLCTHCFGSPETQNNLFIFGRVTETTRRDAGTLVTHSSGFPVAFVSAFAPPVQARQNAPPNAQTRRHLLLSIFLI